MALIDVLEPKDIAELRRQIEELIVSFDLSVVLTLADKEVRLRIDTRPRTRQERLEMLSKLAAAR